MSEKSLRLPWVPGIKRPNFIFYRIRLTLPSKIPSSVIYFAIFGAVFYIFMGGVYDLIEKPFARGADSQGNPILIYPDVNRQFLIEGVVAALVMFMGALGLYLLNQATSDPHNPTRASYYQILGVVLLTVAFIIIQSMYAKKKSGTGG